MEGMSFVIENRPHASGGLHGLRSETRGELRPGVLCRKQGIAEPVKAVDPGSFTLPGNDPRCNGKEKKSGIERAAAARHAR